MEDQIRAVVFDVGGVLTDYHQADYFEKLGYSPETAAKLVQATQKSPDWKEYDRGVLTDEEVRARFKKAAPELSAEIDAGLTHMYGLVTARGTAIPWVEAVKDRGMETYVLSNFSATCYRDCQEALGFEKLMNGCLWSFQHQVIKPDDAAFLLILHMFHLHPEETVYIDDTPDNVKAAARLGMHGIHYTTQQETEKQLFELMDDDGR